MDEPSKKKPQTLLQWDQAFYIDLNDTYDQLSRCLASVPNARGLVRRGPALWEVLLLLASLARRADTGQRGEKALVGDELGFGVEDQSETRLVAEVDSAVVGEDLVQEQVSERGRDCLSVRRVGLSVHQPRPHPESGLGCSRCTRRSHCWRMT